MVKFGLLIYYLFYIGAAFTCLFISIGLLLSPYYPVNKNSAHPESQNYL